MTNGTIKNQHIFAALGELYALLEEIQIEARGCEFFRRFEKLSIDRPSLGFPKLIEMTIENLKKLNHEKKDLYHKSMCEIMDKLDGDFPERLTVPEQGVFQLAYYHSKGSLARV